MAIGTLLARVDGGDKWSLMSIRGLGQISYDEIMQRLHEKGLITHPSRYMRTISFCARKPRLILA